MFGWIPVLGPIIDGLISVVKGFQDIRKTQILDDGSTDRAGLQSSQAVLATFKDDIGVRLMRDIALFFPVIWSALIGWDTVVAKRFPDLMFKVADYPHDVSYIPYMAFAFLFGNLGLIYWKRK